MRQFLELRSGVARGDLDGVDEHDRVPCSQLVDHTVGRAASQGRTPQQPSHHRATGRVRATGPVLDGGDRVGVSICEGTLSLAVGIAGEAPGALAAPAWGAHVGPDRRSRVHGAGESADDFLADVPHGTADQAT